MKLKINADVKEVNSEEVVNVIRSMPKKIDEVIIKTKDISEKENVFENKNHKIEVSDNGETIYIKYKPHNQVFVLCKGESLDILEKAILKAKAIRDLKH